MSPEEDEEDEEDESDTEIDHVLKKLASSDD